METHRGHIPPPSAWFFLVLSGSSRCKRGTLSSGPEEHAAGRRPFLGQQGDDIFWEGSDCLGFVGLCTELTWHYPVGHRVDCWGILQVVGEDSVPSWAGKAWRGGGRFHPTACAVHTHPVTAPSFGKDWSHTPVPLAEAQKREVCVQEGGGRAEIMQRINEIRTRQGQIMYHYTPETKG